MVGNQELDGPFVRLTSMKKLILAAAVLMALGGCAPDGEVANTGNRPDPSTSTAAVDLETWCASRTPDRCVEGLVYLDWNPGSEDCVFTVADDTQRFWELCDESVQEGEPVTTIPTEQSEAERLSAEQDYRDEVSSRLPALDERATALLTAAHPDGTVTAGLLFVDPIALADVEQLAAGQGVVLVSAWRTDYLCFSGIDDWPVDTASRFAYLDGVDRARQLRQEMENSATPVTGAHIPLDGFAVMEQEAVALREPGVLIEAVQAGVPVGSLESLRNDPHVAKIRLADFPVEWLDLSDPPVPTCAGG
jgi:hypothetical protein